MAHWLKAAEDLFEVVDRRAKLVVGDEQPNSQLPASNGQGSQAKSKRLRAKPKKEESSSESSAKVDTALNKTNSRASLPKVSSFKDLPAASTDNHEIKTKNEEQEKVNNDISKPDVPVFDEETAATEKINQQSVSLSFNSNNVNADSSIFGENLSTLVTFEETEAEKSHPTDSSQDALLKDEGSETVINKERSQSLNSDTPLKVNSPNVNNVKIEHELDENIYQEYKPATSPKKVQDQLELPKNIQDEPGSLKKVQDQPKKPQDQSGSAKKVQDELDEAKGLLESSKTTGQSKEARLARVCAGLSSRLQEYKSENAQLEELLIAERELSKSYEAHIQQLQKELSLSKEEVQRVESSMLEALGAKNAEIKALASSMDTLKKQATLSEGNLASLQANMESIMRSRELTETRMMQALKEELASAERRAEEERAAHNATKMAAMEREVELEHRALDASTALAKIQRTADERTTKAVELEQKVALLEVECSSLTQELQDMEARARRGQKKSPEDANQGIQMQAWQEEVERARQGQRDAERKLSTVEAELQKMRVEMAAMKRDAEHYSRQEHMELEKRYREITDLLYYKQTQLEAMTSEKAAAEFQLEKEMRRIKEAQVEVERSRVTRRASASWEEDTDMKALVYVALLFLFFIWEHIQTSEGCKNLDSGAVRTMRFLWRYPVARLFLVFYMVFVHLFMMYLLHRLQEQADIISSREIAESMGLGNHTLP
ncbi:hypothetical protein R6Q59_033049 [Mikania micrantha]